MTDHIDTAKEREKLAALEAERAKVWRIIADDPPPDDGRDLLLFQAGWGISPIIVGRTHDDTWVSDCFDIDAPDQRPTHWMPLPDEPQVERTND